MLLRRRVSFDRKSVRAGTKTEEASLHLGRHDGNRDSVWYCETLLLLLIPKGGDHVGRLGSRLGR